MKKKCFKDSKTTWKNSYDTLKYLLKKTRVILLSGHPGKVTNTILNDAKVKENEVMLLCNEFPFNQNLKIKMVDIYEWIDPLPYICEDLKKNRNIFLGVPSKKLLKEYQYIYKNIWDQYTTGDTLWVHGDCDKNMKNPPNGVNNYWKLYQMVSCNI